LIYDWLELEEESCSDEQKAAIIEGGAAAADGERRCYKVVGGSGGGRELLRRSARPTLWQPLLENNKGKSFPLVNIVADNWLSDWQRETPTTKNRTFASQPIEICCKKLKKKLSQ
jgi:hypothetical protein